MQPGQTISPGSSSEPEEPTVVSQAVPVSNATVPAAAPTPITEPTPDLQPQDQPPAQVEPLQPQSDSGALATWTASEYIAHAKGLGWFVLLGVGLFVAIGLVYLLTKDIFASVLVGIAGLTFAVFSVRPPRILNYEIHAQGIVIGEKSYPFAEFKSFAVDDEGPIPSLLLMPLKRFLPPITVFYAPEEEDSIINAIADYLPHEEREPDMVDRLMSRIRF